jgi:hypothetical protein
MDKSCPAAGDVFCPFLEKDRHRRLLRARREPPRDYRAAKRG